MPRGKPEKLIISQITNVQSHSIGEVVCQLCFLCGSPKRIVFWKVRDFEVCNDCKAEAIKIEKLKDSRKIKLESLDLDEF